MKRIVLLVLVILSALTSVNAQDVSQHVLSSGNGSATALNGDNIQYTIGQALYSNIVGTNNTVYLTQGFEQPSSPTTQNLVNTSFPDLNLAKLDVYPNPAVDYTEIALNLIDNNGVQVVLSDIWGQVIKVQDYRAEAGNQKLHFSFGALSAGVYTIKVKANQSVYAKKLLVGGSVASARN